MSDPVPYVGKDRPYEKDRPRVRRQGIEERHIQTSGLNLNAVYD